MIVAMKKVAIIVQDKDVGATLQDLRALGVMHIEHQKPPQGEDVSKIQDDLTLVNAVLGIFSEEEYIKRLPQEEKALSGFRFTARHIIDLCKRVDQLQEYSRALVNRITQLEQWGDFDPQAIEDLAAKNIFIRLYEIPFRQIKDLTAEAIVKVLSVKKGIANCAIISRTKLEMPFKELTLPKAGLEHMRKRLAEDERMIKAIKDEITGFASYREDFLRIMKSLEKELEFCEAFRGRGSAGNLGYLVGYVPRDTTQLVLETARTKKWAIDLRDPSEEDRVPTLIRNPAWISIIRPIFRIIEVMPGYRELDISLWFLLFLSIFFGMLIGDAGYGVIFFALTFFAQKKFSSRLKEKSVFILFYLFSLCAIAWGILTGTFFGQEWLGAYVKPLIPALRDDKNMQALCFFLGATHLSIAHLWRFMLKLPSPAALSDLGWVSILWGAFFLARTLILGDAFPFFAKWFFIMGAAAVLFFTKPQRNILKGIGAGFGNLLLNLVNNFTDVVSYIRLFAVGLATIAVADAFNKMAMDIGFNSFLAGALTVLVILVGHVLNVILGPMAVLVHGVRLNVLEFCNHIDVKWNGFSYKPLRAVEDNRVN